MVFYIIFYEVSCEYLERTRNDHCRISKGNTSKNVDKKYSSYSMHVIWWCFIFMWSFMKIAWKVFTRNYNCRISKANNSKMYRQELLFLCCVVWRCFIFLWSFMKYLKGFQVIERTPNDHCQISKGNNYKTIDKSYGSCVVHVIWWCFMFVWRFMKISWRVFKL